MKTQTLEQELEGFEYVEDYAGFEIWAKGDERILYDTDKKEVHLRYNMKEKEK